MRPLRSRLLALVLATLFGVFGVACGDDTAEDDGNGPSDLSDAEDVPSNQSAPSTTGSPAGSSGDTSDGDMSTDLSADSDDAPPVSAG